MMKKLTALFLALALLCSLAGCGERQAGRRPDDDSSSGVSRPEPPRSPALSQPEEEPEDAPDAADAAEMAELLGYWDGDVYCNEALGIDYVLPSAWQRASDEELLQMVDIAADNEFLSEDTKLAAELAKSRLFYGMVATDPANGSSVQIAFLNMEGLAGAGSFTEEHYVEQIIAQQETLFDESVDFRVGDTYHTTLGGTEFLVLPATINMSGIGIKEWICLYFLEDRVAMITVAAQDTMDVETMEGGAPAFKPHGAASGGSGAAGPLTATGDIGRTFDTMFFDYTVVSAASPAEYDGYTAADGNKLLVVGVKVKNDFGSTLPMYDTDFQIQWGPGDNDYAWAVDAFNDKMMPLEWEIEDDDEITYDMLFEVPADVDSFSLVYLEEYTDRDGNDKTGELFSADFTLLASSAA